MWEKDEEKKAVVAKQVVVNNEKNKIVEKKKVGFKEKREFEQLEKEISSLEAEKEQLTNQLSDPELGYDRVEVISKRLTAITNELEQKEMRWLELSEIM